MTKKSYFFWGVYEGNEGDETWQVLHEHFEKLSREDNVRVEAVITDKKAVERDGL